MPLLRTSADPLNESNAVNQPLEDIQVPGSQVIFITNGQWTYTAFRAVYGEITAVLSVFGIVFTCLAKYCEASYGKVQIR